MIHTWFDTEGGCELMHQLIDGSAGFRNYPKLMLQDFETFHSRKGNDREKLCISGISISDIVFIVILEVNMLMNYMWMQGGIPFLDQLI